MSSIQELQQRVVQAEERFGLINAERAKYSERLMGLIDAIETRLGDQQTEIERQAGEAASQAEELETLRRDAGENKLLRGMLQSLLNAIELGNSVALSETMQVLDTKISALIDESSVAETVPSEAETPELERAEIEAAETEIPEVKPAEAEALEIEAAEPLEEESAAPEPEAADSEPEVVTVEAEVETVEAEVETADAEVETADAEVEMAEAEVTEVADPEDEPIPEENTDEAGDLAAAVESQAAPEPAAEPEPEANTGEPEVLEIPASVADVTMIDEEMVIGAASDEAPPVADAVEENLIDEAGAVLDVPVAADAGEQKSEASSLEDIMRRVSKLVEDEGAMGPLTAGGVQVGPGEPSPETQGPEPAEVQSSASGG